jgi:hypothetical protein
MQLFGYVCSPLCRARADSNGIEVPIFEGQKTRIEARRWKKVGTAVVSLGVISVVWVAFWIWYTFFGLVPKPVYSVRFPEASYSGQTAFAGTNQLIFLHGGTLARHDLKAKKEIWSRSVINRQQIEQEVSEEIKAMQKAIDKANSETPDNVPKMPDRAKLMSMMERAQAASVRLGVQSTHIYLITGDKLTFVDWETGATTKEIPMVSGLERIIDQTNELVVLSSYGSPQITHINLSDMQVTSENLQAPTNLATVARSSRPLISHKEKGAGLPLGMPGRDAGRRMDVAKVESQAAHLSYPAKVALPATLASSANQERTLAALNENEKPGASQMAPTMSSAAGASLIAGQDGFFSANITLLESRIISRSAVRSPKKSVMTGALTASQSTEAANEILNEMQKDRGGDIVSEDLSRYQVALSHFGKPDSWTGEVVGYPKIFPLRAHTAVSGVSNLFILDQDDKLLWRSALAFPIADRELVTDQYRSSAGLGPVVEHGDTIYVFDQGVLSAFDARTGNARWRYPSVGITGLFFDDKGMVYVNTSSAGTESLKYSREIDVNRKTTSVIAKIDTHGGKVMWVSEPGGLIQYVSRKYIYTSKSFMPDDSDADNPYVPDTGFEARPYLRIARLNPRNGHVMWVFPEERAPWDIAYSENYIRLVFKKEVEILKSVAF